MYHVKNYPEVLKIKIQQYVANVKRWRSEMNYYEGLVNILRYFLAVHVQTACCTPTKNYMQNYVSLLLVPFILLRK